LRMCRNCPCSVAMCFCLASDGLTRELSDAALSAILAAGGDDLQLACERMVAGANAEGGRDNITCVLVRAGV
jgi:serine/threonine protein phosphatase PrpC